MVPVSAYPPLNAGLSVCRATINHLRTGSVLGSVPSHVGASVGGRSQDSRAGEVEAEARREDQRSLDDD